MNSFLKCFLKDKENTYGVSWNNKRRFTIGAEIVYIIFFGIFLIAGFFFDNEVANGTIRFSVEEFHSLILSIIGIQATISTLSIALVALISNNISETYMGIAISHYYLNIRPWIFKQNRIIYCVMSLLSFNIYFYVKGRYNLIIFFFAATVCLVILSTIEIYALFRGVPIAKNEIKLFLLSNVNKQEMSGGKRFYKKKMKLFENFSDDWATKSPKQNHIDYEDYRDVFFGFFSSILLYNTDESLILLKECSAKEISSLLYSENDITQGKGIALFSEVYEKMWNFVIGKDYKRQYTKEFNLLGEVFETLKFACERMPIDTVDQFLKWKKNSEFISRVSFCIMTENTEAEDCSELQYNIRLSMLMGHILRYKCVRNKEELSPIISKWGSDMYDPYIDSSYNILNDRKSEFLWDKCKVHFNYFKGFNDNLFITPIIENVFYRGMGAAYSKKSDTEILYYLSVDCYLYYLAEKENESCINKELKEAANKILDDSRVRGLNEYYMTNIIRYLPDYKELENNLYQMLREHEKFPRFTNAKVMIMENVVREFYIFLALICNYKNFSNNQVFNLNENTFIYINQFLEGNEMITKKNLKRFYILFSNSRTGYDDSTLDKKIDEMYIMLEKELKQKYKLQEVSKAEQEQKNYEEVNVDGIINSIKSKIQIHMENTFGTLSFDTKEVYSKWTSRFNVLDINLFTDMIKEDVVDDMFANVDTTFVGNIITELLTRCAVSPKLKSSFKNDLEYIQYLRDNKLDILMGSEYVLKNNDYTYMNQFKNLEKNCNCIYTGYFNEKALAIRKGSLQIKFKSVDVVISSLVVSESVANYDEENNTYSYNVSNDIYLPFTKDELILYINNKRKLLNISIEVEVSVINSDIGRVIVRDDA